MINILCSYSNFDEAWGYASIEPYLHHEDEVCILVLEHSDGWAYEDLSLRDAYESGAAAHETLVRPFRAFGIADSQIHVVSQDNSISTIQDRIRHSDVLVLFGSHPNAMIEAVEDLQIRDAILRHKGVVMGISAGAMVQLDLFHMTSDYFDEFSFGEGLNLIGGFDVDIHYQPETEHLYAMIRSIEDLGRSVVCIPQKGMMIVDGDHYELVGEAFVVSNENLDELYEAYEQSKSPYGW